MHSDYESKLYLTFLITLYLSIIVVDWKTTRKPNFSVSPILHQFIIIIIVKTYHFNKRFLFFSLMQFQKHNRTRKTRTKMQKWLLLSFVLHPLTVSVRKSFYCFQENRENAFHLLYFLWLHREMWRNWIVFHYNEDEEEKDKKKTIFVLLIIVNIEIGILKWNVKNIIELIWNGETMGKITRKHLKRKSFCNNAHGFLRIVERKVVVVG